MSASPEVLALQRIAEALVALNGNISASSAVFSEIRQLLYEVSASLPSRPAIIPCCSHPPGTTCTRAMPTRP